MFDRSLANLLPWILGARRNVPLSCQKENCDVGSVSNPSSECTPLPALSKASQVSSRPSSFNDLSLPLNFLDCPTLPRVCKHSQVLFTFHPENPRSKSLFTITPARYSISALYCNNHTTHHGNSDYSTKLRNKIKTPLTQE